MSDQETIDRWWQLALKSTPGELLPCVLGDNGVPTRGKAEAVATFLKALAGTEGERFHGVIQRMGDIGDLPGGDVPIGWFGCGDNAEDNAAFFKEARTMVLTLLEERAALIAKLKWAGVKL